MEKGVTGRGGKEKGVRKRVIRSGGCDGGDCGLDNGGHCLLQRKTRNFDRGKYYVRRMMSFAWMFVNRALLPFLTSSSSSLRITLYL